MIKGENKKRVVLPASELLFLAVLIGVVEMLVRTGVVNSLFLPAPSSIIQDIGLLFKDGFIWPHFYVTLSEFLIGYSIAALLGIA